MFSLPVLAALAAVAVVTSFISGIFGMAGGMLLIGFLLVFLPVPVAMVFHGVIQIAANGWRAGCGAITSNGAWCCSSARGRPSRWSCSRSSISCPTRRWC